MFIWIYVYMQEKKSVEIYTKMYNGNFLVL